MRQPPTPQYVRILEITVLIMIAAGLALARLSFKIPDALTSYLSVGAILAGLAAIAAFYSARRARSELERQAPEDPTPYP